MKLPPNKTRIVCTIGPASDSPAIMLQMIEAGMDVARLNFSHGDPAGHGKVIEGLRAAAGAAGRRLAIMADLPGPKMRIGKLAKEPIELRRGDVFTLTTSEIVGDERRASVSFERLPAVVRPGDILSLNDGIIQMVVDRVGGDDVECRVQTGGELRSRKGLNLPGIDLGISAFTDHDRECLEFALEHGVDAVSQSFVDGPADVDAVRAAAADLGHRPFVVAKIERAGALRNIDSILGAADGIMIARGDLGVEIPLETIAVVQKRITAKANAMGRPVITATQMLESMVDHGRPTRAEATDVANAILDGTDCVMLSEESAMGRYPVEAVRMLAGIAAATEPHRKAQGPREEPAGCRSEEDANLVDLISHNVAYTVERLSPTAVIVPTASGYTARMISRFKLPVWIAAVSPDRAACQGLQLSYGVSPVHAPGHPGDWRDFARRWLAEAGLPPGAVVMTEGPSPGNPDANPRMEILVL